MSLLLKTRFFNVYFGMFPRIHVPVTNFPASAKMTHRLFYCMSDNLYIHLYIIITNSRMDVKVVYKLHPIVESIYVRKDDISHFDVFTLIQK